ncbi:MAG: HEAT repeat domain-containing protein [Spirochaetaceae bacterium]
MAAGSATAATRAVNSALRTLGLDSSASWRDIRVAYATRVKEAHPDSSPGRGSRFLLEQTISAYRVLKSAYRIDERRRDGRSSTPLRTTGPREPRRPTRRESPQQQDTAARAAPRRHEISITALGNAALTESSPDARARACVALGQTGKRSVAAYLRAALYDDSDEVVIAATSALAVLRARSPAGDYACIYESATQPVRSSVLSAAVRSGPAECFRSLFVKALSDSDRSIRRMALSGLSRLEPASGV